MNGPCAKQTTRATIIAPNGRRFVGENDCENPQTICPRAGMATGVGYELCQSICRQTGHAEVNACRMAGQAARGGVLYLEGHYYACDPCKAAAEAAGVSIVIGEPPNRNIHQDETMSNDGTGLREAAVAAIERLRAPALMFDSDRRLLAGELESALSAVAPPPVLEEVFAAIDAEPEFPGAMPDAMFNAIRDDKDAVEELMRIAVRATKRNIKARLAASPAAPAQPEMQAAPVGFVSPWVVESLHEGCSAVTTITPHQAMTDDVAIYTLPPPPTGE